MKLHHRIICIIIMVVVLKGRDINNPSKNDHEGLKIDLIVKLHSSFFLQCFKFKWFICVKTNE